MRDLPFNLVYSEELYSIEGKTAVVITQPWDQLSVDEKVQLSKISDALRQRISPRLGLEAFQVVSVDTLDLSTWHERPSRLIYFGDAIKGLSFYEVIETRDTRMVLSENLNTLLVSEPARTKLWQALKQLFSA